MRLLRAHNRYICSEQFVRLQLKRVVRMKHRPHSRAKESIGKERDDSKDGREEQDPNDLALFERSSVVSDYEGGRSIGRLSVRENSPQRQGCAQYDTYLA